MPRRQWKNLISKAPRDIDQSRAARTFVFFWTLTSRACSDMSENAREQRLAMRHPPRFKSLISARNTIDLATPFCRPASKLKLNGGTDTIRRRGSAKAVIGSAPSAGPMFETRQSLNGKLCSGSDSDAGSAPRAARSRHCFERKGRGRRRSFVVVGESTGIQRRILPKRTCNGRLRLRTQSPGFPPAHFIGRTRARLRSPRPAGPKLTWKLPLLAALR